MPLVDWKTDPVSRRSLAQLTAALAKSLREKGSSLQPWQSGHVILIRWHINRYGSYIGNYANVRQTQGLASLIESVASTGFRIFMSPVDLSFPLRTCKPYSGNYSLAVR